MSLYVLESEEEPSKSKVPQINGKLPTKAQTQFGQKKINVKETKG